MWVPLSAILPLDLAVKVGRLSVSNPPVPHWNFAVSSRASVSHGADASQNPGAIAKMVSNSTSGADSFIENIAVIVLVACWLIGIIDSYRLGVAQEK